MLQMVLLWYHLYSPKVIFLPRYIWNFFVFLTRKTLLCVRYYMLMPCFLVYPNPALLAVLGYHFISHTTGFSQGRHFSRRSIKRVQIGCVWRSYAFHFCANRTPNRAYWTCGHQTGTQPAAKYCGPPGAWQPHCFFKHHLMGNRNRWFCRASGGLQLNQGAGGCKLCSPVPDT